MLLLLFFNLTLYAMVRAIEAEAEPDGKTVLRWLGVAGAGFGLLALSHALTICIFLAALAFTLLHFRSRVRASLWLAAPVFLLYTPWLLRNWLVCGNPGGSRSILSLRRWE